MNFDIMDINLWMIPVAIIAIVLVIKLCKSIITKIVTTVVSIYVVFGETLGLPTLEEIAEKLLHINF